MSLRLGNNVIAGVISDTSAFAKNNEVVHKTGSETISGAKFFEYPIYYKSSDDASTSPTSVIYSFPIIIRDKNDHDMSFINQIHDTDGWNWLNVWSSVGVDDNRKFNHLGIGVDVNGNQITYCPPCSDVNSILTTTGISKAQNGYVKLGNGIIIQWGYETDTSDVSFPTPFTTTNYGMGMTVNSGYGDSIWISEMSITNRTNTGFHYGNSYKTHPYSWIAIGY